MSPYFGLDVFQFIILFIQRCYSFLRLEKGVHSLASDEIQFFTLAMTAVSLSLLGCFLLLRKAAMLANSLSHTILLGVVLLFILSSSFSSEADLDHFHLRFAELLAAAFISVVLTSSLTFILQRVMCVQEDASIGLTFTFFFSLAILLVTLFTKNVHIGSELVMGNVDVLGLDDMTAAFYTLLFNIAIVFCFYRLFLLFCFDASFARCLGFSAFNFEALFLIQLATTIVTAFRAVGVLMVLSLLTLPFLIARLFFHQLWKILLFSSLFSVLLVFLGVALSRHFVSVYALPLSTAGLIVVLLFICFLLALALRYTLDRRLKRTFS